MLDLMTNPVEQLRSIEKARIQALVEGDIALARLLHSPEFRLVTSVGQSMSRDEYLTAIETGEINYVSWEPGEIAVRLHGDAAVLRCEARREIVFGGCPLPPARYWHIDAYEQSNGAWQVVWSQITEIY
jgi:hypothetical protein